MKNYTVYVEKYVSMTAVVQIKANNEEEVHKKLMNKLGDLDFRTDKISIEVRDVLTDEERDADEE